MSKSMSSNIGQVTPSRFLLCSSLVCAAFFVKLIPAGLHAGQLCTRGYVMMHEWTTCMVAKPLIRIRFRQGWSSWGGQPMLTSMMHSDAKLNKLGAQLLPNLGKFFKGCGPIRPRLVQETGKIYSSKSQVLLARTMKCAERGIQAQGFCHVILKLLSNIIYLEAPILCFQMGGSTTPQRDAY
eukprot:1158172-Pelagomonas_calceolata.AAC.4